MQVFEVSGRATHFKIPDMGVPNGRGRAGQGRGGAPKEKAGQSNAGQARGVQGRTGLVSRCFGHVVCLIIRRAFRPNGVSDPQSHSLRLRCLDTSFLRSSILRFLVLRFLDSKFLSRGEGGQNASSTRAPNRLQIGSKSEL